MCCDYRHLSEYRGQPEAMGPNTRRAPKGEGKGQREEVEYIYKKNTFSFIYTQRFQSLARHLFADTPCPDIDRIIRY